MNIGWIKLEKVNRVQKLGGSIYNDRARKVLSKFGKVDEVIIDRKDIDKFPSFIQLPFLLYKLTKIKERKNIWIRDFYSTMTINFDKTTGKNIVLIHHIDFTTLPKIFIPLFKIYEFLFYLQLKKADFIIVMSDYWKKHFLNKGFKNVYTIYNPIDYINYRITLADVLKFKKKYHLEDRPIIYLGNCRSYKGVKESYEALKSLPVHLVTAGHQEIQIPTKNLNLNHKEHLILMKAARITIAMSKFKEGWSMTVHESLYCGTPVIGSGKGGMIELLKGGKQIICTDFKDLKNHVEKLLKNKQLHSRMSKNGYRFAKQFTKERFERDWKTVIEKVQNT